MVRGWFDERDAEPMRGRLLRGVNGPHDVDLHRAVLDRLLVLCRFDICDAESLRGRILRLNDCARSVILLGVLFGRLLRHLGDRPHVGIM